LSIPTDADGNPLVEFAVDLDVLYEIAAKMAESVSQERTARAILGAILLVYWLRFGRENGPDAECKFIEELSDFINSSGGTVH